MFFEGRVDFEKCEIAGTWGSSPGRKNGKFVIKQEYIIESAIVNVIGT